MVGWLVGWLVGVGWVLLVGNGWLVGWMFALLRSWDFGENSRIFFSKENVVVQLYLKDMVKEGVGVVGFLKMVTFRNSWPEKTFGQTGPV